MTISKLTKKKIKFRLCLFTSSIKRQLMHFCVILGLAVNLCFSKLEFFLKNRFYFYSYWLNYYITLNLNKFNTKQNKKEKQTKKQKNKSREFILPNGIISLSVHFSRNFIVCSFSFLRLKHPDKVSNMELTRFIQVLSRF